MYDVKPTIRGLDVLPDGQWPNAPAELRERPQWVAWRSVERDGAATKVPFRADGGGPAKSNEPATWATFDDATARVRRSPGRYAGVGYVFSEDDPYVGIDFDGCLEGGVIADWARPWLDDLAGSYMEISPSGKGVKVWARGKLPGPGGARRLGEASHSGIEAYDRGRYFAVTGDALARPKGEIPDRQEVIDKLHAWIKAGRTERPRADGDPITVTVPSQETSYTPEHRAALYLATVAPAISGQGGHDTAFRAAMVGPAFNLHPDVACRLLMTDYSPRCEPPWSEQEVRHKVASAYAKEPRRGWLLDAPRPASALAASQVAADVQGPELDAALAKVARTDLGNAVRMATRFRGEMRFCKIWGEWLVWDGARYAPDHTGAAVRLAGATARSILAEASAIEDADERKAHIAWAMASQSRAKIDAMLALTASELGVSITPDDMNREGWLLNCANGTVDLRTGELRPHDRADLITQLCPVAFDPYATCPQWEATLDLFFAGNQALKAYWQRVCGYALVGEVRDHVLIVAYGEGSNGKSTILGTLLNVFGRDYAMKAPPNLLMAKAHDPHPVDRADLFSKRLVVAIETGEGRRLDETAVKELTGGDAIRARRMRENPWEFEPSHTIVMATNAMPVIRGADNGIWRRIRKVPFLVTLDGKAADTSIPSKLKAEAAGILAWCIRGCLAWQEIGLNEPESVAEATAEYRSEQDVLGPFLEERTILDPSTRTRCGEVYQAYASWTERAGERPMSLRAFGEAMKRRGIETVKSSTKWYVGVGLKPVDGAPDRFGGDGGQWDG